MYASAYNLLARAAVMLAVVGVVTPAVACPCEHAATAADDKEAVAILSTATAPPSCCSSSATPPASPAPDPHDTDQPRSSQHPKPCSCPPSCGQWTSGKLPLCATQLVELLTDPAREEPLTIVSQTWISNPSIADIFRPPRG